MSWKKLIENACSLGEPEAKARALAAIHRSSSIKTQRRVEAVMLGLGLVRYTTFVNGTMVSRNEIFRN